MILALVLLLMAIDRGFWASGISRTRSMCSRPFSSVAPVTCDVVGELEAALERTRGDALIEDFALVGFALLDGPLRRGRSGCFPASRSRFVFGEAGDRDRDAIVVFAGALDVVGRVGRRRLDAGVLIQHREEPVETDGRTIERERSHKFALHILLMKRHEQRAPNGDTLVFARPNGPRSLDLVCLFGASRGCAGQKNDVFFVSQRAPMPPELRGLDGLRDSPPPDIAGSLEPSA